MYFIFQNSEGSLAVRWSESLPSLFAIPDDERPDSPSLESSNERSDERGATPPGPVLSNDMLKGGSVDRDLSHLDHVPSNGMLDSTPSRKADTLGKESTDNVSISEERPVFCDCPPDPELPVTFNLEDIL